LRPPCITWNNLRRSGAVVTGVIGWVASAASIRSPIAQARQPCCGRRFVRRAQELVYKHLPPGVLDELERLNPNIQKGRRKYHHHRFLSGNIGNPHLEKHVAVVTALMRVSPDWNTFMKLFGTNFKRVPQPDDEPDLFDD
jgi:hypothetical protein